ncbi:oxysterol-binding protein-related protein 4B-like isoform X1 [Brassica napus]|uniref:oxysterol-binding protein-related protein 4B-like isoform X1 n=1 Tax=Brassica napus TaxID=3708 RepID=UPI000BBEAF30|nr:oxysterol-binding protein-related protein 4B-like isoform X1 [Brassica napus]
MYHLVPTLYYQKTCAENIWLAEEQEIRRHVVLTKPYSLEDEKDSEHTAANVIRRILSLLKNVRPGSDLTNFQLPPQLNLPKSQLQCYGEMIYSFGGHDLLGECSRRDLPIERLKSVVAWNISKLRPVLFGQAPYNPVLGETHHVSSGHINVLIEQVSHHPPVSALQATHEEENIDVMWVQHFIPKFRGAYVELEVKGKRVMKLQSRKETYDMNQPRLVIRLVPVPRADWAGKMKIKCPETDLEAELHLVSDSFIERFRGSNNRAVKGKISESSSGSKLYDIFGHWDRTISAKSLKTGEVEVIYNANGSISGLKPPTVNNLKEVMENESAMVWSEVSEGILNKDWERAREAKKAVEDRQRESLKQREASGESWVPKHFSVVRNGKDWDCTPLQPTVPRAPLVITEAHEEIMN